MLSYLVDPDKTGTMSAKTTKIKEPLDEVRRDHKQDMITARAPTDRFLASVLRTTGSIANALCDVELARSLKSSAKTKQPWYQDTTKPITIKLTSVSVPKLVTPEISKCALH